jgi:hypothetical protein
VAGAGAQPGRAGAALVRDAIRGKGRGAPRPVCEPLVALADASPGDHAAARRFAEALAHDRAGRFAEAGALRDGLARAEPGGDAGGPAAGPAARMAERARALALHPPRRPWDGVWPGDGESPPAAE